MSIFVTEDENRFETFASPTDVRDIGRRVEDSRNMPEKVANDVRLLSR